MKTLLMGFMIMGKGEVEWEKIAVRECQKLVESMPKRVRAVLKAKGATQSTNTLQISTYS